MNLKRVTSLNLSKTHLIHDSSSKNTKGNDIKSNPDSVLKSDEVKNFQKNLEEMRKVVATNKNSLQHAVEGEEKYIKFLSKRKITTLPSKIISKKASRKALLVGGLTGLATAISPIIGAAGISALLGIGITNYVVVPTLFCLIFSIRGGLTIGREASDFIREVEEVKYNLSPTEAIGHLKKGEPVYVDNHKVSSLKDLDALMETYKNKLNKEKPE